MTSANGPEPGTRTRNPLCGTRPPNRSSNASPATAPPSIIRRPPDGQNTNITTLQPDRTLGRGMRRRVPDPLGPRSVIVVAAAGGRRRRFAGAGVIDADVGAGRGQGGGGVDEPAGCSEVALDDGITGAVGEGAQRVGRV